MAPPIRTERGLDRLVNFTDAAVAISITLLILPLVDLASQISHETLVKLLHDHWPNLLAFVISFAVIGNMWMVHHRLFELVTSYDSWLARQNLIWLATITVLPFSTNVIASAQSGLPGVYALYIGNVLLASGVALWMRWYIFRHPDLLRDGAADQIKMLPSVVPTAILIVCLLLAVLVPAVGTYWLLLLFASAPIEHLLERLTTRKSAEAQ